jgi:hypothetical protein
MGLKEMFAHNNNIRLRIILLKSLVSDELPKIILELIDSSGKVIKTELKALKNTKELHDILSIYTSLHPIVCNIGDMYTCDKLYQSDNMPKTTAMSCHYLANGDSVYAEEIPLSNLRNFSPVGCIDDFLKNKFLYQLTDCKDNINHKLDQLKEEAEGNPVDIRIGFNSELMKHKDTNFWQLDYFVRTYGNHFYNYEKGPEAQNGKSILYPYPSFSEEFDKFVVLPVAKHIYNSLYSKSPIEILELSKKTIKLFAGSHFVPQFGSEKTYGDFLEYIKNSGACQKQINLLRRWE